MSVFINLAPALQSGGENDAPTLGMNSAVEDRVRHLFSTYSAAASQEKTAIFNQLKYGDATNPAALLQLQNRVGNYSLAINMISTLTHKSVAAIDTVLKAQ